MLTLALPILAIMLSSFSKHAVEELNVGAFQAGVDFAA